MIPSARLALQDTVVSACTFHLSRSPAPVALGFVCVVDVDPRTPERAVKARIKERYSADRVDVVWRTHRHLLICIMFPPALPHFADTLS
jgi:hypothetical protein